MLQLQPIYQNIDEWIYLANRDGLCFELHELVKILATSSDTYGVQCIAVSKSCGISQSFHGAYIDINPFSGDRDFADLSHKKILESCMLAKNIGCRNIVFHCSCFPTLRGPYFNSHIKRAGEYYSELAESTGLHVYLENSFDTDPDPLAGIMQHVTSDKVLCCLDIGHANISRVPVAEWFNVLKDTIGYLHLSDNMGYWDEHLPLGNGTVDWEKINELCDSLKLDVPMTLETGSLHATKQSLQYLKERGLLHA